MIPEKTTTIYIARDIERAMGMQPSETYRILTNRSSYAESVQKQYPTFVTIVDAPATGTGASSDILDTVDLLKSDECVRLVADFDGAILVFKNTPIIEALCTENGWMLLNPSAALAEKIENKISQIEYLGDIGTKHFPPHETAAAKDLRWVSDSLGTAPRIIQWAHGHTGDGTVLVSSEAELVALQKKFPDRPARATALVEGPSFTANVVVTTDAILCGNISYQITGLTPFTDNRFATVGNDWSATHTILTEAEIDTIRSLALDIGARMQKDGWRGLFGIDVMKDDRLDKIFLVEINARQPASTAFESALQMENRARGVVGTTTFEAHLAALRAAVGAKNYIGPLVEIHDGAQIVQRVTAAVRETPDDAVGSLELSGYTVIAYENTATGADLLRIQSDKGLIGSHSKLNARGEEIRAAILSL